MYEWMLYGVIAGPVCPSMCDVWWGAYIVPTQSETDLTPDASTGMPDTHTPQPSDPNRSRNTIAVPARTNADKGILLQSCVGTTLVFSVSLKDKYRNKVQAVDLLEGLGVRIQLTPNALGLSSMSDQKTSQDEKISEQKHNDDLRGRSTDGVTKGAQQEHVFTFLENTNGVIPCIFECPTIAGEYHMIVSLGTETSFIVHTSSHTWNNILLHHQC